MNKKIIGLIAIVVILVTISATATPAQAAQDLKITDWNLHALTHYGTWTPYKYSSWALLEWGGVSALDVRYQSPRWVGNILAITTADHNGWHWGECVSFAKALSKSTTTTGSWSKGSKVMTSNVAPGTVIATFFKSNGGYKGHTAIFRGHTFSNGRRTGILVWDQNYVSSRVVGRHSIRASGSDVNNANNYYVVRV